MVRPTAITGAVSRSRLWLVVALLAVTVLGGWYFGHRAAGDDRELPVYVTGAARLVEGAEIYRRGTDDKPFTYPPFAAVPFVPMTWLPETWQAPAWFAVNFAILLLIVRWLHRFASRELPGAPPPRPVVFWLLTLAVGVHHVLSVFTNQSHDLLILGTVMLVAAAWTRGRDSAGAWAGLGAAIKATPLLFVGLFGLRLRWRALALLAVVAVGLSLLPDWLTPRADGRSWLAVWYDVNLRGLQVSGTASAAGAWNAHSYLNQSLSGTLTRLLTAPAIRGPFVDDGAAVLQLSAGACRAAIGVAQVLVLAVMAFGIRAAARVERAGDDAGRLRRTFGLGEVAAIALGMVLLSPQSSKSHFCVWLPAAAFVVDRVLRGRRDVWLWAALIGSFALGALTAKGLVGREVGARLNAWGNVTWCTVLLLLGVVRALATARRQRVHLPR